MEIKEKVVSDYMKQTFYEDIAKRESEHALNMSNFAYEEDYNLLVQDTNIYIDLAYKLDCCETSKDFQEWEKECNEAIKETSDSTLEKWLDELMYMGKEETFIEKE